MDEVSSRKKKPVAARKSKALMLVRLGALVLVALALGALKYVMEHRSHSNPIVARHSFVSGLSQQISSQSGLTSQTSAGSKPFITDSPGTAARDEQLHPPAAVAPTSQVSGAATDQTQAPAVLSTLTLTPGSVDTNGKFTIQVDLSSAAPAGGATVDLSINGTAKDPIVVPEGNEWSSINYTAGSDSSTLTVDATYDGITKEAVMNVTPELAGITVSPATVSPGDAYTITVNLTSPAPSGGVSVDLSQDWIPQYPIVVAEGDNWSSVTYKAGTQASDYTASYDGQSASAGIKIYMPNCHDYLEEHSYEEVDPDMPCTDNFGNVTTLNHPGG